MNLGNKKWAKLQILVTLGDIGGVQEWGIERGEAKSKRADLNI